MAVNTGHTNVVHEVWTEMQTTWKYSMYVHQEENFTDGNLQQL